MVYKLPLTLEGIYKSRGDSLFAVITERSTSAASWYCGQKSMAFAWKISSPVTPQQNAYVERYNRTGPYDWLGHYLFESVAEVQEHATRWVGTYNHERPNMALGGITPKQKLALLA